MSSETNMCYICYEEECADKPFLNKQMCACTSKADSSLKIHQLCLELSRDKSNKCSVCKSSLSTQWAFDDSFKVAKSLGGNVFVSQGESDAPHGIVYTLVETGSHVGPIRALAHSCQYKHGEKHGVQIENHANGATTEINWVQGKMHGKRIERDSAQKVVVEASYDAGMLHGPWKACNGDVVSTVNYVAGKKHGQALTYNTALGACNPTAVGNYVNGELHGLQQYFVLDKNNIAHLQKQLSYKNGVRHGPVYEWMVNPESCESRLLYQAMYKNGFRHGRFVSNQVIHRNCKVTEEFWSDGSRELRHGLHRIESDGKVFLEARYVMGKRQGQYIEYSTSCGQLQCKLNFNNGRLHGVCELYVYSPSTCSNTLIASGKFNNGVSVGRHTVYGLQPMLQADGWFSYTHGVHESVNYDENGQLHGTCIYNKHDCQKHQVLSYKHGVLHGRQQFFEPNIVFHMKDGVVCGKVETYDERGVMQIEQIRADDGVSVYELTNGCPLRYPAQRARLGFDERYMCKDGTITSCVHRAAGNNENCTCDECYVYEPDDEDYDYTQDDYESEYSDDDARERAQEEREWREWEYRQRYW